LFSTKSWSFKLNPELSWDDVSEDTKLRLKSLPEETVQAASEPAVAGCIAFLKGSRFSGS